MPTYPANLSITQVRLLQSLSDGSSGEQVAKEMGISPNYVKRLLQDARDKTGMDTTYSLIAWCFRNKVLI